MDPTESQPWGAQSTPQSPQPQVVPRTSQSPRPEGAQWTPQSPHSTDPWPHSALALAGSSGEGRALGQWGPLAPQGTPGVEGGSAPRGSSGSHGPSSTSPTQLRPGPPGHPPPLAPPNPTDPPLCLPQSRDRKVLGDYSGALSYGSTAKYLNITAQLLNVFLIALVIALIASGTITVVNLLHRGPD
ncbi:hypothetical protein QYF61_013544 [Mycteria americana]|uniref:Uncharacterized protein n=1 Tax=Mycteria americana TaxID=33587 RepID=A0AAN7P8B5_MYCAM|nr:hypothetical protein QYF61_013544 [Mycteria americana]